MSVNFTPKQNLLLFSLLAKHGVSAQAVLRPAPTKADRVTLEAAKLVSVERQSRSIWLRLEDAGWAWLAENLDAELPHGQEALADFLDRLDSHLQLQDLTLAEFVGPEPELEAASSASDFYDDKADLAALRENKPSPAEMRAKIENIYLGITGGRKGVGAPLSKIREGLEPLDRMTVDATFLRILQDDPKMRFMRLNDPRAISKAETEAAFNPGGEPFHTLWILP